MQISDEMLCRCLMRAGHTPGDAITREGAHVLREFAAVLVRECVEACTELEMRSMRAWRDGRAEKDIAAGNAAGNCRRAMETRMRGKE